jgi:hypothetical protein
MGASLDVLLTLSSKHFTLRYGEWSPNGDNDNVRRHHTLKTLGFSFYEADVESRRYTAMVAVLQTTVILYFGNDKVILDIKMEAIANVRVLPLTEGEEQVYPEFVKTRPLFFLKQHQYLVKTQ